MKLNTLEKLYLCMEYEMPEITMDEELRLAAKKPIDRMLEISKGRIVICFSLLFIADNSMRVHCCSLLDGSRNFRSSIVTS